MTDNCIVHQDALETDKRVYAVFTYVNVIGTFLLISSCDAKKAFSALISFFILISTAHYRLPPLSYQEQNLPVLYQCLNPF